MSFIKENIVTNAPDYSLVNVSMKNYRYICLMQGEMDIFSLNIHTFINKTIDVCRFPVHRRVIERISVWEEA